MERQINIVAVGAVADHADQAAISDRRVESVAADAEAAAGVGQDGVGRAGATVPTMVTVALLSSPVPLIWVKLALRPSIVSR